MTRIYIGSLRSKSNKISFKIKQNMELKEFAQMEQKLKGTQPKEENSAAIALVAAGNAGDMNEEWHMNCSMTSITISIRSNVGRSNR